MKKLIIIALLAFVNCSYAQYVEAGPNGLTGIAEFKTAQNKYADALAYVTANNADTPITSENLIILPVFIEDAITVKSQTFDVSFNQVFTFTDGTAQVYFKDVTFSPADGVGPTVTFSGNDPYSVYNTSGEVKNPSLKLHIEMLFNNSISRVWKKIK